MMSSHDLNATTCSTISVYLCGSQACSCTAWGNFYLSTLETREAATLHRFTLSLERLQIPGDMPNQSALRMKLTMTKPH